MRECRLVLQKRSLLTTYIMAQKVRRKGWSSSLSLTLAVNVMKGNEKRSEGRTQRLEDSSRIRGMTVQRWSEDAWGMWCLLLAGR